MRKLALLGVALLALVLAACGGAALASQSVPALPNRAYYVHPPASVDNNSDLIQVVKVPHFGTCVYTSSGDIWCK